MTTADWKWDWNMSLRWVKEFGEIGRSEVWKNSKGSLHVRCESNVKIVEQSVRLESVRLGKA